VWKEKERSPRKAKAAKCKMTGAQRILLLLTDECCTALPGEENQNKTKETDDGDDGMSLG
jgi:hypothetical protein